MRSMFMLAALAAVIGFTGCCGTGGSCKLGSGLGAGKGLLQAGNRASARANSRNLSSDSCGCGSCGSDSTVSVSTPYACDDGCGGSAPMSAPSPCGCSSCDGGGAVEYAAPVQYAPAQSGDCGACSSTSAGGQRGLCINRAAKRKGIANNRGMGLGLKSKGKACEETRSLSPSTGASYATDMGVVTGDSCDECSACVEQTVAQMPGGFLFGGSSGERRISTGVVSDIRNARGGCRGGGCVAGKIANARAIAGGCGKRGCGAGKLCGKCTKLLQAAGLGHPYGGAVPHTNPAAGQQPQSGIAPQYAYPYYTTRGPRDFLRDNPPSIGY